MDLNIRILIVDDFSGVRKIIRAILKKIGFKNIGMAESGKAALGALKREKYDLVLCDWNMPDMSGLEVLKIIKSDDKLMEIPFIMVTAEAQKQNVIDAVRAGVSNYIVKPFTEEQIAQKLEKVFES